MLLWCTFAPALSTHRCSVNVALDRGLSEGGVFEDGRFSWPVPSEEGTFRLYKFHLFAAKQKYYACERNNFFFTDLCFILY